MKILIIAEHDNQVLKPVTHHVVHAATRLNGEIDLLVLGQDCATVAIQATQFASIKQVYCADNGALKHALAEPITQAIVPIATEYQYILTAATTFGKNVLARLAGALDVSMISDVIAIISEDTFQRPIYAGNAIATIQTTEKIKLLTIRSTAFPAENETVVDESKIKTLTPTLENNMSQFISEELTHSSRPELTAAKIIISGGRGLKSAENFSLIEEIADLIGAGVGASRAAVDAGFAPNDYQIGQTGKIVAPDLYIAVGISGAIQHLAGMKDSKTIVAINQDAEAPIFALADYGLVGDLFKILPELKTALQQGKK